MIPLRNRISALLVDSDRSSQIAQSSFLRLYGVDTQTASNGLSAFVLASASSSTSDLIVIDISLPVMDGLGVASAIRYMRARGINCKIIGMTGCWG
ncbi:two-component response regulator ARR22 [Populus alba x Populus x berolinensis]|uniref:Two-component response regulator ARR22 n=1 Tax=Populus alba x Populus x berolinensis TaxID=444605 RepID=A0AAD6RHE4_9ROSI|nr:two-component response regulator ARR22 [Populus alba x Populus x berolinensis]